MGMKPIVRMASVTGIAALLAGTAMVSATGVAVAQDKQTDVNDPRSRRVCRTVMPTSSRITRRICRTQAEWDQNRDRTQEGVLKHQMEQQTTYDQIRPG